MLRPRVFFFPGLPSLGCLLVLYAFWACLILRCSLVSESLTLPQHARASDRYAGSKFGIHNFYKVSTRLFPGLTTPCLPHRYPGNDSLLAWNHLVDELFLQKPHFFGILLNLPNTFITSQANFGEGRLESASPTPQLLSTLICVATAPWWEAFGYPHGFLWFPSWHLYPPPWNWNTSWGKVREKLLIKESKLGIIFKIQFLLHKENNKRHLGEV